MSRSTPACPSCGEATRDGASFCGACGAPLRAAPPPPPFPFPSAPPAAPDLAAPGPAPARVPVPALVVGGIVAVALVLLILTSAGGGDGSTAEDDTETAASGVGIADLTTPVLTDDEYVVDMLAVGEIAIANSSPGEQECEARAIVVAMGGAEALRAAGITPEELADTFGLRGEEIPEGAVDRYLATAASCGLDLTEVLIVRPVASRFGPAVAGCVGSRVDRAFYDRAIASFFLDPARSTNTLELPPAVQQAHFELVSGCL